MTQIETSEAFSSLINPLDIVENLMGANGWAYERVGEEEISAALQGQWCEYQLRFYWREEGRVLQAACMFDIRIPEARKKPIYETLARINERLWIGHFETWLDEGVIMYRHASFVRDDVDGMDEGLCQSVIQTAIGECERFYPVFQFVIWAGKSPAEAIEAALLETVGEA